MPKIPAGVVALVVCMAFSPSAAVAGDKPAASDSFDAIPFSFPKSAPPSAPESKTEDSLPIAPGATPSGSARTRSGSTTEIAPFSYPTFDTTPLQAEQQTPATPAPPPTLAKNLRLAGVICGATGVVAVGFGFYYWTHATSLANSANHATIYKQSDYDGGNRAETMQWIFYGTGTAALVTGATLYIFGKWILPGQRTTLSLAPVATRGAAGLRASGTF
jgi:hypothetical protein